MPRYDFRCADGHVTEEWAGFDRLTSRCECGAESERVAVPSRVSITGFAVAPMRERPVNLSRFIEAQGQMVRDAERTGVPAPDVLGDARKRAAAIAKHAPEIVTGT